MTTIIGYDQLLVAVAKLQGMSQAERDALMRSTTPSGYQIPRPTSVPQFGFVRWQVVQPASIYLTRTGVT